MNIDAQQIYNMNSAGIKPTMVGGSKDKVLKGIDMTEKIGTYLTLEERARARIVDKNESMKYIITREEMDKELELHIEQLQRAREDMRRSQEMLGSLSEIRREINDELQELQQEYLDDNDNSDVAEYLYKQSLQVLYDEQRKNSIKRSRARDTFNKASYKAGEIQEKIDSMQEYRNKL
jgi:hypothetical protein